MKIDPKFAFYFGIWTSILLLVASATFNLTNMVPDTWIPMVKAWAANLGAINSVILTAFAGYSSAKNGPLAPPPTVGEARQIMADAQAVLKTLLIILASIAMLVLAASDARAQEAHGVLAASDARAQEAHGGSTHLPVTIVRPASSPETGAPLICDPLNLIPGCKQIASPTGNIDLTSLWSQILAIALPDLEYANALALSPAGPCVPPVAPATMPVCPPPTPGGLIRSACWTALINANRQASGTGLKNADGTAMISPDPHLLTDVERLGEVIDNLSPTGPVFSGCAAAAQAAKMSVLTFIATAVTGAAGLAALGVT